MSEHTPGPWYWHRGPGPNVYAEDGTEIGQINFSVDGDLIAAAPDLLAALEDMINHCQNCNGRGRCYGRVPGSPGSYASNQPCQDCGDARAAIAKARGK